MIIRAAARSVVGRRAWTRNPPPGVGAGDEVPPTVAARSRIPTMPCPPFDRRRRRRRGRRRRPRSRRHRRRGDTVTVAARVLAGVAHHVGERLLHDAVGGHVDRRRAAAAARRRSRARRAARRRRVTSTSASSRSSPGVGASGAASPSSARSTSSVARSSSSVCLLSCLTAASAGRGLLGVAIEHVQRGARLHVDRGDAVGDHVVEVAGDAQALLGDPAAGLLLAALLEVARPLLELGEVGAAVVLGRAEEHRPADPAGEGEADTRGARPARRRPTAITDEGRRSVATTAMISPPPVAGRGDRVERAPAAPGRSVRRRSRRACTRRARRRVTASTTSGATRRRTRAPPMTTP